MSLALFESVTDSLSGFFSLPGACVISPFRGGTLLSTSQQLLIPRLLRLSLTELLRHTGLHHAPHLLVSNPNNHLEMGVAQFPDGDTGSEFEQQDQLVGGGAVICQRPLTD